MRVKIYLTLLSLSCLFLSSCTNRQNYLSEKEEPAYQRAQRYLRENRSQEALHIFLKLIDHRKEAPESHLEAGRIYLQYSKDPISAIYHFRKYLEYKPHSTPSPIVRQLIETAQKEFVRQLPGKPFEQETVRMDLTEVIRGLREENLTLKKQLAASRQKLTPIETIPSSSSSDYQVQPGDTLSSISRKVYGTPKYWEVIFKANRDRLPSPGSLQPGQILKIPNQ